MNRIIQIVISLIVLFAIGFLAWRFSTVVTYILIAAVFSFMGHPLVRFLDKLHLGKFRIPHMLSTFLALVVLILLFVGFFSILVPLIIQQGTVISQINFEQLQSTFQQPINEIQNFMIEYGVVPEGESLESYFSAQLENLVNMATFQKIFSGILGVSGQLFIGIFAVLFITFFFMKDERLFFNGIQMLVPNKYEEKSEKILNSSRHLLSRYFLGLLVELTSMVTLITIGLSIFGVENALLIGFFGGIMNVIPYLGPVIGACLGIILNLSTNLSLELYDSLLPGALTVAGTFIAANLIDNIVLQPWIYSTSVKAHPLEIFLVIMIAGSLAGIVGMILAIPAYTVIRIIAKQFLSHLEVVQKLTSRI